MLILITYDVETVTKEGQHRLRKIAKLCTNYGQRVQNSVFECSLEPAQLVDLKKLMKDIINKEKDNIRIYHMGKNWQHKVETMGKNETYDPDKGVLFI